MLGEFFHAHDRLRVLVFGCYPFTLCGRIAQKMDEDTCELSSNGSNRPVWTVDGKVVGAYRTRAPDTIGSDPFRHGKDARWLAEKIAGLRIFVTTTTR